MASVPAAPIRQPRGPTSSGFGRPSSPSSNGPPPPDSESTLRRNNTVGSGQSTSRHATSASLGGSAAANSAFHSQAQAQQGQKYKESRFRSGSLSSQHSASAIGGGGEEGLVRRISTKSRPESRGVQEEVVLEDKDLESPVGGLEGGWGKGLGRQSSLPSRRGYHTSISSIPPVPPLAPPPRPPRRTSGNPIAQNDTGVLHGITSPSHSHTLSLSSLSMLSKPIDLMPPPPPPSQPSIGATGVSRTQSLRNQAKHAQAEAAFGLGRSTSLRQAGEHLHHHRYGSTPGSGGGSTYDSVNLASPPTQTSTPNHPFTPPSPPPQSSTAALPPFQLPLGGSGLDGNGLGSEGQGGKADVKRHQSLGQRYGRLRDRLDRAPALLSLEQRHDRFDRPRSGGNKEDEPPTSPLGHSVWSPQNQPHDDGWTRSMHGVSEALAGMTFGTQGPAQGQGQGQGQGQAQRGDPAFVQTQSGAQLQQQLGIATQVSSDGQVAQGAGRPAPPPLILAPQHPNLNQPLTHTHAPGEEPAWVASLLGGRDASPQPPPRAPSAPVTGTTPTPNAQWPSDVPQARWPDGQGYLPLGYLQQQQQQQLMSLGGAYPQHQHQPGGMSQQPGGYGQGMKGAQGPGPGGMGLGFQTPNQGYMPGMPLQMPVPMPVPGMGGYYGGQGPGQGQGQGAGQMLHPQQGYGQGQGHAHSRSHGHTPVSAPHFGAQDQAVIELAKAKGLNPATFDCQPAFARFFVIKSYTEEDVQKSLKHEIWSSTVLGNKRLDTAFKESSEKGPVYLFFSVNGSRHFCGVAEMLTAVDETQNSTVWTQDKWKGIFKVRWIFVRDVPSTALRHIRLIHTPEQKPITNSRDTQELHYEAGCEVLQIFLDYQTKSKTSLLQDFAYYESLSQSRSQNGTPASTPLQGQNQGPNAGMLPPQPAPNIPLNASGGSTTPNPALGQGSGQGQMMMPVPVPVPMIGGLPVQMPMQPMMGMQGIPTPPLSAQGGQFPGQAGQGRARSPHGMRHQHQHQQQQQQQPMLHPQQQQQQQFQAPPVPPIPVRYR